MHEEIKKSADHLQVSKLQEGKIQYTDATNAERLFMEHNRDIRYFTAWKKWLVWNGTNWKTEEGGALIHEKGLTTVRNIYQEMLKTCDSREKWKLRISGGLAKV
jgi:phage/plasmid-associated DNA primase